MNRTISLDWEHLGFPALQSCLAWLRALRSRHAFPKLVSFSFPNNTQCHDKLAKFLTKIATKNASDLKGLGTLTIPAEASPTLALALPSKLPALQCLRYKAKTTPSAVFQELSSLKELYLDTHGTMNVRSPFPPHPVMISSLFLYFFPSFLSLFPSFLSFSPSLPPLINLTRRISARKCSKDNVALDVTVADWGTSSGSG